MNDFSAFRDPLVGTEISINDPLFPFDVWRLPYQKQETLNLLPCRDIAFVLYDKEITKKLRSGFNGIKKDFRQVAYEECHRAIGISKEDFKSITKGYDIHHNLPSHMGGTNDFDNLVFIDPFLHRDIHRRVDCIVKKVQKINRDYDKSKKPKPLSRTQALLSADDAIHITKGKVFITIPWPEGKVCIPQLVVGFHHWAQRGNQLNIT